MCKEYNGYTNYPTWNVMLWIDNDQGLYHTARELVRQETEYTIQKDAMLKDFVETMLEGDVLWSANMQSDLLGWALSSVDWRQCVDNLLEA